MQLRERLRLQLKTLSLVRKVQNSQKPQEGAIFLCNGISTMKLSNF